MHFPHLHVLVFIHRSSAAYDALIDEMTIENPEQEGDVGTCCMLICILCMMHV